MKKAAEMVGLPRSTFYRHIDEKGISIDGKGSKRPTVDISELIRVYGENLRIPGKSHIKQRPPAGAQQDSLGEEKVELLMLREKVLHLEQLRQTEKAAAAEQIELLKKMLDSEQSERRQATALITDQRGEKVKQAEKIASLENELSQIKKAGFFTRLFGFGR